MNDFLQLTEKDREKLFRDRISTEFKIDRQTLNFNDIERDLNSTDLNQDFELPPIIMDNKHLGQIFALSSQDNMGRWIRTMIRTYLEGGRVIYCKLDENYFLVKLKF